MFNDASNGLKIFSGTANKKLTIDICEKLNIPLGQLKISHFSDGEISVAYDENIRGTDCFLIQPTCNPVNKNLMELLIMIDAARRASAKRITSVIPYYGYARQDRKHRPRVAITAKLVANLLEAAGADRVLTIDLHAGQIQGFFDIPLDNLYAGQTIMEVIKNYNIPDLTVVSPDFGGIKRARAASQFLNVPLALIDKRRPKENVSEVMNIIGEVKDRNILMIDDMIDTAGTLCKGAAALKEAGAKDIYGAATHGVLSGDAIKNINESCFKKVFITDSILVTEFKFINKIEVITISTLLAQAIDRIHNETTISKLFDKIGDL